MKNLIAAALTLTLLGGVATTAQADDRNSRFEQRDHRHDDKRGPDHRNDRKQDHKSDHKSDHRGHDFKDRDRHRDHRFDGRPDHRPDHWRHDHRPIKHKPYVKPSGYRYRAWRHGDHLPRTYRSSRYIVNDYRSYRLSAPPRGYHWVRVDKDVVLAAIASGLVAKAIFGVF